MGSRFETAGEHLHDCRRFIEEIQIEMLFVQTWEFMSDDGLVDAYGSCEFQRVYSDWLDAAEPANVVAFILYRVECVTGCMIVKEM